MVPAEPARAHQGEISLTKIKGIIAVSAKRIRFMALGLKSHKMYALCRILKNDGIRRVVSEKQKAYKKDAHQNT